MTARPQLAKADTAFQGASVGQPTEPCLSEQIGASPSMSSSWARTENEAPVAVLYRTCVHWVQLGEACDIVFVHLDRLSKYDPVDRLTARRCRERSLVVVIRTLGRAIAESW